MIRSARRSIRPQGYSAVSASPRAGDRQSALGRPRRQGARAVVGVASDPEPPHARRATDCLDLHRMKSRAPHGHFRIRRAWMPLVVSQSRAAGPSWLFASLVGESRHECQATAGGNPDTRVRPRFADRVHDNLGERARPKELCPVVHGLAITRGSMQPWRSVAIRLLDHLGEARAGRWRA